MSDNGHGTCGCGRVADKTSSGSPECWPCWHLRKLDRPAARFWERTMQEIFNSLDPHDFMTYLPACGLSKEEIEVWVKANERILLHSREVNAPGYRAPDKVNLD